MNESPPPPQFSLLDATRNSGVIAKGWGDYTEGIQPLLPRVKFYIALFSETLVLWPGSQPLL